MFEMKWSKTAKRALKNHMPMYMDMLEPIADPDDWQNKEAVIRRIQGLIDKGYFPDECEFKFLYEKSNPNRLVFDALLARYCEHGNIVDHTRHEVTIKASLLHHFNIEISPNKVDPDDDLIDLYEMFIPEMLECLHGPITIQNADGEYTFLV